VSVACASCGGSGKVYAPTSRPCKICHGTGRVETHADDVAARVERGRRDAAITDEDMAHMGSGVGGETRAMRIGRVLKGISQETVVCAHCGSTLRRWKFGVASPRPLSPHTLSQLGTADGRPPKLGAHGCNAFCSVRCGFDWAVGRLRRDAGDES